MKRLLTFLVTVLWVTTLFSGCKEKPTEPVEGGMKIATSTSDFGAYVSSHEEQIDLLYEAGFRYIDLSFYTKEDNDRFMKDNWQEAAAALKKYAEDKGMSFVQAHSFGGNALKDQQTYNQIVEATIREIEVCAIMDIPQIVVHAPYEPHLTKDEFFEKALAFYKEFFPVMERTGIKVLIENSAKNNVGCDYYFYTGADMRAFIEYANNPLLGACWDTGHANIEGHQYEDIVALGDLLMGVHIADNRGEKDEHLMPYQGTMCIDEVMCALVETGYTGAFTFECENNLIPGISWPYARTVYDQSQKAYKPSLEIKLEMEKTLYSIGKYILTQYEIPLG